MDIRGFYLFVCQEPAENRPGYYRMTALALCDGNLLNQDFKLYLEITGLREKQTGLGTYGEGSNRNRPMVLFTNPLGSDLFDRQVTLVSMEGYLDSHHQELNQVGVIKRTIAGKKSRRTFYCYRVEDNDRSEKFSVLDPFRKPRSSSKTSQRGRFKVDALKFTESGQLLLGL